MPQARRSTTSRSTTKRSASSRSSQGVRARAASTSTATRREVERSIARFEKRLDEANEALQTLGKHLGRGAQSSYKEVTAALRALRRDAAKTNRQALKDLDKLRAALTQSNASSRSTRTAKGGSTTTRSGSRSTSRSSAGRSTTARSASSRSTGTRSTSSRSGSSRSAGSRAKKS